MTAPDYPKDVLATQLDLRIIHAINLGTVDHGRDATSDGDMPGGLAVVRGRLLVSTPLPSVPVAPPRIADFDLDGVADVVVVARGGYYGLRTSLGTGSLALQVLFGFFGIAVVLTLALRQQDNGEGGGGDERPHAAHRSKLM